MSTEAQPEQTSDEENAPPPEWLPWSPRTARRAPEVLAMVEDFESLDVPAGHEAADWLKHEALPNHGSTTTHLLVGTDRVEGFIALCCTSIKLLPEDVENLGVPHRPTMPAIRLAWVAKHRHTSVPGQEIVWGAYGHALEASEHAGAIGLVVDPYDDAVAKVWVEKYGFMPTADKRRSAPSPLWTPLERD